MAPVLGIWASSFNSRTFQPTGSYDALATYTVPSGGVSSITFAGLPTGGQYTHLQIRALAKSSRTDSPIATYKITLNADNAANYSYHRLSGDGSSAGASGGASFNNGYLYSMAGSQTVSSSTFGVAVFDILDYATSNKNKTIRFLGGTEGNSSGTGYLTLGSVGYYSTTAINSIKFEIDGGTDFVQYSQFSLYGVKG